MSIGVLAGLVWIGFAAHRTRTAAVMAALVECIPMPRHPASAWVVGPVAQRLGALQQAMSRYRNVTPGEDFTGYS